MMDLDEVFEELKKFDRYKFYEEPHVYTYLEDDGMESEVGISVTTLIEDYANPFDEDNAAENKSKKIGVSKHEILDKWHYDRDFACLKGTHVHAYNENLWRDGSLYKYDKDSVINEFGSDVLKPIWNKLKKICDLFYDKFKDNLIPIGLEQIVGSRDYDIAGSIDFLAYSKKLNSLIIIDYKTNKSIKSKSFNNIKMLSPLGEIDDCNFYHYSLQLAIYKYILEHETNLKVYPKKWLIWINEENDNFKLYECANLDDKAKEILELRRVKK